MPLLRNTIRFKALRPLLLLMPVGLLGGCAAVAPRAAHDSPPDHEVKDRLSRSVSDMHIDVLEVDLLTPAGQ